MGDRKKSFCLLSGFSEDIDRAHIKREFGKFGTVTKIYLTDDFAKVYFEDQESCRIAARGLSVNNFGWVVEENQEKLYKPAGRIDNTFGDYSQSKSVSSNFGASSKKPQRKMNDYSYLEEEFSENMDYCDIHGNPLVLFQADTGEKYVNVEDVRRAGFALFRKDSFNPLLVDKRQIQKEFELHLLSESKNYILKNKAVVIDEEQILRTIERCKNKLLGGHSSDRNQSLNQTQVDNTFVKPERPVQQKSAFNSFETSSPIAPQRAPKTLPNQFVPTTTQRNSKPWAGDQQRQQRPRQNSNRETNGFGDDTFSNKGSSSHKSRQNDQGFGFNSSRTRSKSRQRDDMSQASDTSDKRRKYADIESIDKIDKVVLDIGSSYDVVISHVEKENICWVHKKESSAELENMLIKLFDLAPELQDLSNPTKGQLVLAMFEEVWCRARIYGDDSPLYVHFLDYGNRLRTETVKEFPEELRKIPVLGLRLVLNNIQTPLALEAEMRIRVNKKYTDDTYVAEVESTNTPRHEEKEKIREPAKAEKIASEEKKFVEKEKPKPVEIEKPKPVEVEKPKPVEVEKPAVVTKKEPSPVKTPKEPKAYFDVPKQLVELKNGDKVMIVDVVENKFATKTKESAQKSKELMEHIKNLDKSTLLLSGVEEGQLVLCSKDGLPNLYRAVVLKKTSAVAVSVRYLDYPGEDQLAVKSLRNVDDFLASQPAMLLLTPEYKLLDNLGPKGAEFVYNLMEQKEKVTVVINDDFDLQLSDGSLLSEKLVKLDKKEEPKLPKLVPVSGPAKDPESAKSPKKTEKPSPKAVTPAKKSTPVTYDDMDWIKLEVGSTESYLCYTIKDLEDLTLISLKDDSINYMARVTDLTVDDTVPYEPVDFEMCLVAYQAPEDEEPQWYRGVVINTGENGDYTIQAVDFGNQVVVKSKDIRKFDEDLKEIPILGISCECVGIPKNAAVLDKLKQLIPEGEEVKVEIKEFDELKYQIELPEVYKTLHDEGLC